MITRYEMILGLRKALDNEQTRKATRRFNVLKRIDTIVREANNSKQPDLDEVENRVRKLFESKHLD